MATPTLPVPRPREGGDCPIAATCALAWRCPWVQVGDHRVPEGCPQPPRWPR